jgi:perosamine synthetase
MVTIILDKNLGIQKESLILDLNKKKIDARPFFYPLSSLPAYQSKSQINNNVAFNMSPYGINLPSGMNITQEHVNYIANAVIIALAKVIKL